MLRVKIPIDEKQWEAEAETEVELEASVRVILRVTGSLKSQPITTVTTQPSLDAVTTRGVEALYPSTLQVAPAQNAPPASYKPPKYRKLEKNTNRERLRLALADLMYNFGREAATANDIIKHLEATGGKFVSEAKDKGASARQTLRTDVLMESSNKGWRLKDEAILRFLPLLWKNTEVQKELDDEQNNLDDGNSIEVSDQKSESNEDRPSGGPLVHLPS